MRRNSDGHHLLGGGSLSRPQGRTGIRGGHSDRHHCSRPDRSSRKEGRPGPECHHPVHRRLLRSCGGGRNLHIAGHLHPRRRGQFHADVPLIPARRRAGNPLPDSVQEVFRKGDAREVSVPGGHGHHSGAGQRRRRGKERQDIGTQRIGRRIVRLYHCHLRSLG